MPSEVREEGDAALPCPARCDGIIGEDVAMPTRLRRPRGAHPEGRKPSGKRPKRTAAEWLGTEEDAFDLWLRQSLHAAFDVVAAEPVPEDILRMIEEDRAERERVRCSRRAKRDG
jgi:hypothetical protein